MGKLLRCDDVVPGCRAIIEGGSAAEIMLQAREHARTAHGLTWLTAGLTILIQQAIRDRPSDAAAVR
jgi:predicted small metal-binding protein